MISRYKGNYEEQVHSRLTFRLTSERVPNQLTDALHKLPDGNRVLFRDRDHKVTLKMIHHIWISGISGRDVISECPAQMIDF